MDYKIKANSRKRADGTTAYTPVFLDSTGQWRSAGKGLMDNKQQALIAAHEAAKAHFATGVAISDSRKTVDQFWSTTYQTHLQSLGPASQQNYPSMYRVWIKPNLGHLPMGEVQAHHVQKFALMLQNKIEKYGTREKIFNVVSSVFTYAVSNQVRSSNPCANKAVRAALGVKEDLEVVALTNEEFDGFLVEVPEYWRPFVLAAVSLGGRASELAGLTPGDVDWDNGLVTISKGEIIVSKKLFGVSRMTTKTTKGKKTRQVPLTPDMLDTLRALCEHRGLTPTSEQRLFVGPNGGAFDRNTFNRRVVKPALVAAGLTDRGATLKSMRSTYVSWLLDRGVKIQVVMEMVGHRQFATTQRYTKVFDNKFDEVRAALGKSGRPDLKVVPDAGEEKAS